MSKQLVIAIFENEAAADAAVKEVKDWDRITEDVRLGAIGVLVKDDRGRIKTHKVGSRRTATGALLFGLASLLTSGVTLLGGLLVGGVLGSLFHKGLGLSKEDMARLEAELDGGKAAVGLLVNPEEATPITAFLSALGGVAEAHELDQPVVEAAAATAVDAPAEAHAEAAAAAAAAAATTEAAEQVKLAAAAFLYGYPLVYNLAEIARFTAGPNLVSAEPLSYNTFGHARELLDPSAHFVSPNNDTLYMIALCDVRSGPLVLRVPDTADRYYVLQFVDAWTNNFAYIGRRATCTAEGHYLLAPHDYAGEVPEGMPVVCAPSGVFAIVGRLAVDGQADLPAAHALQDQFTLTPLSVHQGGEAPAPVPGVPQADARVGDELKWWESFRVALAAFPPPAADAPLLALGEKLGLTAAESPYVNPDPALMSILVAGQQAAENKIEELVKTAAKPLNGWQNTLHVFDYNLDYFELGALNDPRWMIADRKTAYVTRTVAARAGLWGNHGYEAVYQIVYVDADNRPLDSEGKYELTLPTPPPVDAFWSLTMYDADQFYLVANPINRYSIGDRTPGLRYGDDGSLTIYVQKDSPGPDKESNWLPAPQSGPFRPIMRLYQPGQPILDGSYVLPAIERVG
jgi:hypothetical protein